MNILGVSCGSSLLVYLSELLDEDSFQNQTPEDTYHSKQVKLVQNVKSKSQDHLILPAMTRKCITILHSSQVLVVQKW